MVKNRAGLVTYRTGRASSRAGRARCQGTPWLIGGVSAALLVSIACQERRLPSAEAIAEQARIVDEEDLEPLDHFGPRVDLEETGPARFVRLNYNAFKPERAMETVRFMDARYRTVASDGFNEVLDELERQLRESGFGEDPRLELRILERRMDQPSWNGRSASLTLHSPGGESTVLHSFSEPSDPDRCMLPENAWSADLTAGVALGLEELDSGEILVTEARMRPVLLRRAKSRGAIAVVSADLGVYNVDHTDEDRHQDAISFRRLDPKLAMPAAQISPRSHEKIVEAVTRSGEASLTLQSQADIGGRVARTLVATFVGESRPDEVVAMASHIQAPGASDNASGAAGMLECALNLRKILYTGVIPWPARSITFIWGVENEGTVDWLAVTERTPVAAVNAVMVGQSREKTGAVPLLERYPDPGAENTLPPDEHTLWGMHDVEEEWIVPNGLSIIARCAMVDVARHVGAWETFENPYEGGTDHEKFLEARIPVVLFWHFTDFTFSTSLDRVDMVDPEETRRMSVAALSTVQSIADPVPADLNRYLGSLVYERRLRIQAAEEAEEPEVAEEWRVWADGARQWFRIHCLGLEGDDAILPRVKKAEEEDS